MGASVLLVDADEFFVQVAQRMGSASTHSGARILVTGSDARRVVTSASYAARAYGIRAGMPLARAVRKCPSAQIARVTRTDVARWSETLRSALFKMTPIVEQASVDEFYLDMAGTERLYGTSDLEALARRVREHVREDATLRVTVGGGPNRMIAKMAATKAKPNGIVAVAAGEEAAFMGHCEVAEIPGVGPRMARELKRRGVRTIEQGRRLPRALLEAWLGSYRAAWLEQRMMGTAEVRVSEDRTGHEKSMGKDRTLPWDTNDERVLDGELLALTDELG